MIATMYPTVNARKHQGRCFELAFKGLLNAPAWMLVHGMVNQAPDAHTRTHHAWLELGPHVYDPLLNARFKRDEYYRLYVPTQLARYSAREAAMLALDARHSGPWMDQPT